MARNNDYYYDDEPNDITSSPEALRREMQRQKRRRKEERRRRRYRRWLMKRIAIIAGLVIVLILVICGIVRLVSTLRGTSGNASMTTMEGSTADNDGTGGTDGTGDSAVGDTASTEDAEADPVNGKAENAVFTEDESTVHMSPVHRTQESDVTPADGEDGQAGEEDTTLEATESGEGDAASQYAFDQDFIDASVAAGFSGVDTDYVASEYVILVDVDSGKVLLDRDAYTRMSPASMTKVLTVLVAAEHLESGDSLKDTVTITQDIVDRCYLSDTSSMYYVNGDVITIEELFYGTILPSGADAAFALADYIAGSEEAFVQLMNDKVEELGLSGTTHMTNPVGIYDENHYSTAYDMAVIMKAAMENDLCREVLSAHTYTAAPSISYPGGDHIVSNWFLRRIEDKDTHGTVVGAKTGFVSEAGCCAVSYQESDDGGHYICCTADTWGAWRAIYDHVAIYARFTN